MSGPLPGDASWWPAQDAVSNASGHPGQPGPGAGMEGGTPAVVFLVNATRTSTSAGNGPGPVEVPAAEAAALVAAKLAIYGDRPPRGWPG